MSNPEFTLRAWNMDDLENLIKFGGNPQVAKTMMDRFPHPYTVEKAKEFITAAANGNPLTIFAIDINGQAIGSIGIHPQTDIQCKNAEMGYWIGEPYWGKGIVSKAVTQMIGYSFKTLDITRIFGRAFGNNPGSQRVLEKAGFVLEARFDKTFFKNGEYVDELVYAVRRK
ncbi:MAG: family N-acetyltransferase [Bacteroidetes bacterium]|nr:family N-acetyltransferase [Bacteroidota bacterium]